MVQWLTIDWNILQAKIMFTHEKTFIGFSNNKFNRMMINTFIAVDYKMNKFQNSNLFDIRYGHNGTSCLLRTICETSETPFYEYNGVFGNIFHILFT